MDFKRQTATSFFGQVTARLGLIKRGQDRPHQITGGGFAQFNGDPRREAERFVHEVNVERMFIGRIEWMVI